MPIGLVSLLKKRPKIILHDNKINLPIEGQPLFLHTLTGVKQMIYIVFSILLVSIFYFHHHIYEDRNNIFYKIIVIGCLFFSWALIVMWFTVTIESWQISHSMPAAAYRLDWFAPIQQVLQYAFNYLPVHRIYLAAVYALPALIIPFVSTRAKRNDEALFIYLRAAVLNTAYFWIQAAVDRWAGDTAQALILLAMYFFLLYLLLIPIKHFSRQNAVI